MLREHRPHFLKQAMASLDRGYARHFLFPHFAAVGEGCRVANPWAVRVFGPGIALGRHVQITAAADQRVSLASWSGEGIRIGDYALVNPGVRISSACRVDVGEDAILAADVYISDADWHGVYDRVYSTGGSAPVVLEPNVWVSERAIVCKGVTIGRNSIVGAGAVVSRDVPPNSVAVGNPATVVRALDPQATFVSRRDVFLHPEIYFEQMRRTERRLLTGNTVRDWLRYLVWPRRGD